MKGAWLVTYWNTVTNKDESVLCSSLPVVMELFPDMASIPAQTIYRQQQSHLCHFYQTEADDKGRKMVRLQRLPMYRRGDAV